MARSKKADSNNTTNVDTPVTRSAISATTPLVFISHDHRDADLAEAFGNLLTDASGGVLQSFRSSDRKGTAGIEFGSEWYTAIMSKLGQATDVVALLTNHSLDRPWILYEAGVAKGKLNTTVLGIAVGIDLEQANAGPFAQFQNCGDDTDSLTKLVLQLIRRNPQASPREEAVLRQVEVFADTVGQIKKNRGQQPTNDSTVDNTSVAKIFEEVKVLVRDLPKRLDLQIREGVSLRRSKKSRRFHPMMIEEVMHHPALRDSEVAPTVGLMVIASFFRDEMPWLYELVVDFHRACQSGEERAIASTRQALMTSMDLFSSRGFMFDKGEPDYDEMYFAIRHMPEMIEAFFPLSRQEEKRKTNPKDQKSIS